MQARTRQLREPGRPQWFGDVDSDRDDRQAPAEAEAQAEGAR